MDEKPQKKDTDRNIDYYKQWELYNLIEESHPMMQAAKQAAIDHSLTSTFPIGIVIVKDGEIISESANGNGYHEKNINTPEHRYGCKRRFISKELEKVGKPKLQSGEGFDLCTGCDTDYHAEARAIREATDKSKLNGAELYMYGHWWCCKDCWDKMKAVGITKAYVVDNFRDDNKLKAWRDEFQKLKLIQK